MGSAAHAPRRAAIASILTSSTTSTSVAWRVTPLRPLGTSIVVASPPTQCTWALSMPSCGGTFFMSRGFRPESWHLLSDALREHIQANDYVEVRRTRWGTRYVVDGPLQCPDGGTASVRSIWNIKPPATHPRLAHILSDERGREIAFPQA